MDAKETLEILSKWDKYSGILQKLGEIHSWKMPSLDDLRLSRKEIQAGYREMKAEEEQKKTEFDGSLVDYFSVISLRYVMWSAKTKKGKELEKYFLENGESLSPDMINALRLLVKDPQLFLNELDEDEYSGELSPLVMLLWSWYVRKP